MIKSAERLGFLFVLKVQYSSERSVQFSSVQDGIYALGKAHMRSTPSLRSSPNVLKINNNKQADI